MAQRSMPSSLLTIRDVAEHFGLSIEQVRRMTANGDLPAIKIGSQWRYHPAYLPRGKRARRSSYNKHQAGNNGSAHNNA